MGSSDTIWISFLRKIRLNLRDEYLFRRFDILWTQQTLLETIIRTEGVKLFCSKMMSYDNLWQRKSEIDCWICQQFIDDVWIQMKSYD